MYDENYINKRYIKKLKTNNSIYSQQTGYNTSPDIYTVIQGGTGITEYVIGDLLVADSTLSLTTIPAVASGYMLISNGINELPTYQQLNLSSMVENVLPIDNGGTNISSYTTGDLLYADTSNTISVIPSVASGNVLLANGIGVPPSYGKVDLTNTITGVLPISNGGTNISTALNTGVVISQNTYLDVSLLNTDISYPNYITCVNNTATNIEFLPSKIVKQYLTTFSTALITTSTIIPTDNTIPQNTEGSQIFTLSITPTSITSTIFVQCILQCASSTNVPVVALFKDSSANAIASLSGSINTCCINLMHVETPGTTSPITYSIRVGPAVAATVSINGIGGAQRFNGTSYSTFIIIEFE